MKSYDKRVVSAGIQASMISLLLSRETYFLARERKGDSYKSRTVIN